MMQILPKLKTTLSAAIDDIRAKMSTGAKRRCKYLVFSSVGDRSNLPSWIANKRHKKFDLVVYYYGDQKTVPYDADVAITRKGLKFENFYHFLEHNDVNYYDAIWVVDDDIIMDTRSIMRMFRLFTKYDLWLAQPSFSEESNLSWEFTQNHAGTVLRYTNFIENGVVIFSSQVLPLLKDTFLDAKSGFGIDYVWVRKLGFPEDKIAIIDDVKCIHPKSGYSSLNEVIPRDEHPRQGAELLKKYGLLPVGFDTSKYRIGSPPPYTIQEYGFVTSLKRKALTWGPSIIDQLRSLRRVITQNVVGIRTRLGRLKRRIM